MALLNCEECGKEVSTKATACPHCGAKVGQSSGAMGVAGSFARMVIGVIVGCFVLLFLAAKMNGGNNNSASSEQVDTTKINANSSVSTLGSPTKLPNIQRDFELLRTDKMQSYDDAINELQKSAIFNQANADTDAFVSQHGQHLINWVGKIDDLRTSHGGKDVSVAIKSSNGVTYRIDNDASSNSPIYRQLSSLQEGQLVRFTGKIIQSSSNTEKWEYSITERGSLKNPEFSVKFELIEPSANGPSTIPTMASISKTRHEDMGNVLPEQTKSVAEVPVMVSALDPVDLVLSRTPLPPPANQDNSFGYAPQNYCYLLTAVLASAADNRDNGVALAKSQSNIEDVLIKAGATSNDKIIWHDAVTAIYVSSVTVSQVQDPLHKKCEEMQRG